MKEVYINKEGVKARIHQWGNEENPTIICFHGLGSTSLSFIELGYLLKNEYNIIAIDLPGHGKTPSFIKEKDYEMPNMIKWIDTVVTSITDNSFYVLAHSWGADIALHYIAAYPSKVIKAVLLDGGYYIKTECYAYEASRAGSIDSLQKEMDFYRKDFDEYCFITLQEHLDVEKSNYSRWPSLLELAAADLIRVEDGKYKYHANSFTAVSAIKSMYYYPPDSIYNKLPNSICLLQSTLPESMGEIRESLVQKFKIKTGSKVKKIDGAGHLIHWDKPNDVVEEIKDWFK